ncbi:MAG: Kdo2-lipid lauroyltransferase/acyltransferase [Alphaproteobacteria bacterium]|jgi:KDO2-lipid IV(A) lauroyltransferase|nr:Kdo2-lipid lauroyltransferase/acyltransferase [Alphaproteobacteria bacterium]
MQSAFRRTARQAKAALNLLLGGVALLVLKALRLTDPTWAREKSGRLLRRTGPWLPEHRTGRANLQAAFPEWPPEEIERVLGGVWDNLGRIGAEFVHLDRLWHVINAGTGEMDQVEFTPETIERFVRLRDDGKPALVFAAHLANWELPALAAKAFGLNSLALYRPPAIPQVRRFVLETRSSRMGLLVPTNLGAPTVIADELARGTHAGMLVDQYNSRGVDVTFFGRRTKANPLMARLARHVDCPIHGTRVVRLAGDRFRVDLTEAIEKPRDAQGEIDVAATMQVISSVIEGWVREYPEQWLWLHRRWR